MFTKDNFYTAYFIDNERKNIEVLIKQEGFKHGNLSVSSIIMLLMKKTNNIKYY